MEAVFGTRGVFARSCGTTRNVDTAIQFSKTAQSCQDAVNQEKACVHDESRVARNANRTYKRHMYASRAEFLRCLAAFTAIFKEDMQRRTHKQCAWQSRKEHAVINSIVSSRIYQHRLNRHDANLSQKRVCRECLFTENTFFSDVFCVP